ncbi:MAG: hypothetical protein IJG88_05375 [Eggerthellaceae bacterium]|nr:hypothetical protein [Eggerthellaceae bacterium]
MTATDELRRLLDERGIEYEPIDSVHNPNRRTLWGKVERGKGVLGLDAKYETIEFKKGMRLTISDCSPAQAVEATLGSDLEAENAKLRELLREILNNCCEGIESTCDRCGCYRKSDGACMADVMAIELGVDV